MAQYEIKDAKTANLEEIYFDKNVGKMCYKNALGIITPLEFTPTPAVADKIFVGILTQTGTSNPSAAFNITDFGSPTIDRDGVGAYSVNFIGGPMTFPKTYLSIVNGVAGIGIVNAQYVSANLVRIYTYNTSGVLTDGILNNAQIVITIKA